MQTLSFNQMQTIEGGMDAAAFGCGLGIAVAIVNPAAGLVLGGYTAVMCAATFSSWF